MMDDVVQRISALPPEKLALLRWRLHQNSGNQLSTPIPRLTENRQASALSFAQERLWLSDQLQPNSPLYHIPATYRFHGPLNVWALERSLSEISRRHEILRTIFKVVDGRPVQVVAGPNTSLRRIDLRELPVEVRDEERADSEDEVRAEVSRPEDCAGTPLPCFAARPQVSQ